MSWRENNIKTEEQGGEEKVKDGNSKSDVRECQCLCWCAGKISLGVISVKCNKILTVIFICTDGWSGDNLPGDTDQVPGRKVIYLDESILEK
ncbi:hypothetical protein J6590_081117 [Homalodisca vitripennis]|nr:hypothetical protein J6590_081117 [Homalodisca vitripennis]